MVVYEDKTLTFSGPMRAHPWTAAEHDARCRYINFVENPELIESELEDFLPFSNRDAVQKFYSLLRLLNAQKSELETNDCGLQPIRKHTDTNSQKRFVLTVRLCLLYRRCSYNIVDSAVRWLMEAFRGGLSQVDLSLGKDAAVVGLTMQPTAYIGIPGESCPLRGSLVMLHFWCYGNDEEEVFDNFGRSVKNVEVVAKSISSHIEDKFEHDAIIEDVAKVRPNAVLGEAID